MSKKTLHLNVKKQWFDMIEAEIKLEEYRGFKSWVFSRLIEAYLGDVYISSNALDTDLIAFDCLRGDLSDIIFKEYDTITFSNGMTHPIPRIEVELNGIEVGEGKEEWGASKGVNYFVLKLGKILKRENIK